MTDDQDSFDFDKPADESGYRQWQARTKAEGKKVETRPSQDSLDFENETADEAGYIKWQAGNEARKKEIEAEYGLILGRPVRVKLRQLDKESEGIIHHREHNGKPILTLGTLDFRPEDIESMTCL